MKWASSKTPTGFSHSYRVGCVLYSNPKSGELIAIEEFQISQFSLHSHHIYYLDAIILFFIIVVGSFNE